MNLIGHREMGLGIANTTILANLMDALIAKQVLTNGEVRAVLSQSMDDLSHRVEDSARDATDVIRKMLVHFSEDRPQED
jgi:hypothetical protein